MVGHSFSFPSCTLLMVVRRPTHSPPCRRIKMAGSAASTRPATKKIGKPSIISLPSCTLDSPYISLVAVYLPCSSGLGVFVDDVNGKDFDSNLRLPGLSSWFPRSDGGSSLSLPVVVEVRSGGSRPLVDVSVCSEWTPGKYPLSIEVVVDSLLSSYLSWLPYRPRCSALPKSQHTDCIPIRLKLRFPPRFRSLSHPSKSVVRY